MVAGLAFHTLLLGEQVWGRDAAGQMTRIKPEMWGELEGRASVLQQHWPLLFQDFSLEVSQTLRSRFSVVHMGPHKIRSQYKSVHTFSASHLCAH